jgi:plastocyanin
LVVAGTGAACGDSAPVTPTDQGGSAFTTVEVSPSSPTLFTVAPGNTITLSAVAKDQNGDTLSGAGSASFSSDNAAIADVSAGGAVTVAAPGTAHITASVTADGVTKTGTATVTALVALMNAGVTAPAITFQPAIANMQPGGVVIWSFGSVAHNVVFTSAGAPADVPAFASGFVSRTFPTNGTYTYHCTIHPGMTGVVQVH